MAVNFIVDYHIKDIDLTVREKRRREILLSILNKPRKLAKHTNDPNEATFEIDQAWPLQMIMRAMPMCAALGVVLSGEVIKMASWVHDHPKRCSKRPTSIARRRMSESEVPCIFHDLFPKRKSAADR